MSTARVSANQVASARDLEVRTSRGVTEIIGRFLAAGEGVAAHWTEFARGVLLFVMDPGDGRSGAFYVYDRGQGTFWLVEPKDGVRGGYSPNEMRDKIREFRLLDFAENPARLAGARQA